jgi:uncharacterized membrane protein YdjX (TVP38/TMEM64 family)
MWDMPRHRLAMVFLAGAVVLAAGIFFAGEDLAHHINAVEAWIDSLGPSGPVAFVGLLVLATSVFVPESILAIAAGALFGLTQGLLVVLAGNVLAASLQYALGRRLLRGRIDKALSRRPALVAIQGAVRQDQLRLQSLLRLTPLNPATVSYMLGAAGVRFATFLFACIGLLPHLVFEVYFGYAGKHIAHMASRGTSAVYIHDAVVLLGLAVTLLIIAILSRIAREAVREAVAQAGPGTR